MTPPRIQVRLLAWGITDQHAETAVQSAQRGSFRAAWDFTNIQRQTTDACPIDVTDVKLIAADCGAGWAYAVYPAGVAS